MSKSVCDEHGPDEQQTIRCAPCHERAEEAATKLERRYTAENRALRAALKSANPEMYESLTAVLDLPGRTP